MISHYLDKVPYLGFPAKIQFNQYHLLNCIDVLFLLNYILTNTLFL